MCARAVRACVGVCVRVRTWKRPKPRLCRTPDLIGGGDHAIGVVVVVLSVWRLGLPGRLLGFVHNFLKDLQTVV